MAGSLISLHLTVMSKDLGGNGEKRSYYWPKGSSRESKWYFYDGCYRVMESKRMLTVLAVICLASSYLVSLQIVHNLFLSLPPTFISPTWSNHQTCVQYKRGFIKLLGHFTSSAAGRKAHPYLYRTRQLSDINETQTKLKYLVLAKHTSMLIWFLAPGQQSFSFSL